MPSSASALAQRVTRASTVASITSPSITSQWLAAAGSFPTAFAAVYVLGAIAAFGIGFLALKKAREVNAGMSQPSDRVLNNRDDDGEA